jgi:glutaredoxin
MSYRIVFFTQPGCLSCELMKVFLEAREIEFEERDISVDHDACREMMQVHQSAETPTLVVFFETVTEVVVGFDPARLDQLLEPVSSFDPVKES